MIAARVLVVEDERVVAMHLRQQLPRLGYEVPAMATSGAKALSRFSELLPDVVLMDIHIDGDIDGIETAARIPPELQIPVIYLTAYSEEATLERARGTRPYGYLLKPFSERELHATIQMVLERRRADFGHPQSEQRLEELVAERTTALTEQIDAGGCKRANAERALQQSQKMERFGQLTGGVAHDFNNFLGVIMGSLNMIQRRTDMSAEELQRITSTAMRAARRAATLTDRLLAFSRRQPLDPKPLSLNQLVGDMSDMLQRALGETVAIQTTLAGDLWWTAADANQLESAVLNLAVNARDAMPTGGKLTIETANIVLDAMYCAANRDVAPASTSVIAVSDNGNGMPKDLVSRAFEPFFTTKHSGQGTGLGLSQVYGFVKQSGGHVKIYSEPGEGTTVKLYLPHLSQQGASPGEAVAEIAPAAGASETILVVEDDDDVRVNTVESLPRARLPG